MIKHLGNGFLLLVMFCSLGCATTQDEDSYIGWHCSGDKRSDDWTCEQRRVKNGQVVDEPIQDTKTASAVDDNREPEKAELVYAGIPNQSWRKQLPTLTNAKVITGIPGEYLYLFLCLKPWIANFLSYVLFVPEDKII